MADLKCLSAVDVPSAHDAIDEFASIWDKKYPKISKSWYENRANLSTYFKFLQELRKLTYTTNAIEGINSKLRRSPKQSRYFQPMRDCSKCCILHRILL